MRVLEEMGRSTIYQLERGGKAPNMIDMIKELQRRTQDDHSRYIILAWPDKKQINSFFVYEERTFNLLHDLSHIQRYLLNIVRTKNIHLAKYNSDSEQ